MTGNIILEWTRPIFTYSTTPSYPLAIIGSDMSCQDWIFSHYINMHISDVHEAVKQPRLFFNSVNVLQVTAGDSWGGIQLLSYNTTYKHELGLNKKSLFGFIYENLVEKRYIFTYVNFNGYATQFDYNHNILIHGIDFSKEIVYLLGFKNAIYSSYTVSFETFSNMFFSEYKDNMEKKLVLLHRNNSNYFFNVDVFRMQIKDYLMSQITFEYFDEYIFNSEKSQKSGNKNYYSFVRSAYSRGGFSFGLEAQKVFDYYLEYFISEDSFTTADFDLRSFRCFMEHKALWYQRLIYLDKMEYYVSDISELIPRFKKRADKATSIFFVLAKMKMSNRINIEKLKYLNNEIRNLISEEVIDLEMLLSR